MVAKGGMGVWKEEILFTAGRNTNGYNQYGSQCGGSSTTWNLTYCMIHLYHSLAHNQRTLNPTPQLLLFHAHCYSMTLGNSLSAHQLMNG